VVVSDGDRGAARRHGEAPAQAFVRAAVATPRGLGTALNLVAVDIDTVSPPHDVNGMAAHLCAHIIDEATAVPCRQLGLAPGARPGRAALVCRPRAAGRSRCDAPGTAHLADQPSAVRIASSACCSSSLTSLPPMPRKPPSLLASAVARATAISVSL
jgi:hypothetical protein